MTNVIDFPDRRREPRLAFNAAYRFEVAGDAYVGKLRNITRHGAFLAGAAASIPQAHINGTGDLRISDGGGELRYQAQIVYLHSQPDGPFPPGAGVLFVESDQRHPALLDKLIADYQRAQADAGGG